MPLEDKLLTRTVEREIGKHSIESSRLHVQVINSIAYIGGQVSKLEGALGRNMDLRDEMKKIADAVRHIRGVNDVVVDCRYL